MFLLMWFFVNGEITIPETVTITLLYHTFALLVSPAGHKCAVGRFLAVPVTVILIKPIFYILLGSNEVGGSVFVPVMKSSRLMGIPVNVRLLYCKLKGYLRKSIFALSYFFPYTCTVPHK